MALASEICNITFDTPTVDLDKDQFFKLVGDIYNRVTLLDKWEASAQQSSTSNKDIDDSACDEEDTGVESIFIDELPTRLTADNKWTQDGMMNYHCG